MNELGQRFREAARDYPGLRHFTVLHDYREFDPTQAVRVSPIMGMYHDLLVRPMCDGRMAGTCHLSGRTSLLSRSVLTELHGMGGVGAVRASVSVLCDKRDANGTPDEQQGRPRAFELLDELARSWVRVVAPEIVDTGGHRYDWPGHNPEPDTELPKREKPAIHKEKRGFSGVSGQWAMTGSNRRLPPCKGGALAN